METNFDAVVLGMGPGGEVAASRLLEGGLRVAIVERELIGGECAYWACIPSKTLLRPAEARAQAARVAGLARPDCDWPQAAKYRDYMIRDLDDSKQVSGYEQQGATVFKGDGIITGPGRVRVADMELMAKHIVIATGSDTRMPPIDGLEDVGAWTNREATTLQQIPERVVLVGGGPVGVELGQMLRRFGSSVTIVQGADRLINREDAAVSDLIREALVQDGIDVRLGVHVSAARREGGDTLLELDDGSTLRTDAVVIATGRSARVNDIGLENVDVQVEKRGIKVDERCQASPGIWALGDVTGVMPFTHVAMYQARIIAANILDGDRIADYRAIPRVVFSDPEIAAVGMTEQQALEAGNKVTTSVIELADSIARPWTYEENPRGTLGLIADEQRGVLLGAWAVAPLAGEWIHQAVLPIKEELPIEMLLDTVAQFPTYSEAYLKALEKLEIKRPSSSKILGKRPIELCGTRYLRELEEAGKL